MAQGDGSNKAKLVIGIIVGVLVLGALCCGGVFVAIPDKYKKLAGQGFAMGQQMAAGTQAFEDGFADDFGEDGRWDFGGGGGSMLLLVGVGPDVELDDATVQDLQDRAWTRYAESFADGGLPVSGVAIGRGGARKGGGAQHQGMVTDWAKHVVELDELVERTGLEAPPTSEFIESMMEIEGSNVRVETNGNGVEVKVTEEIPVEETPTEETPAEQPDDE